METCYYETVEKTSETEDSDKNISRKYLLRQILVCSGLWVANFCAGLCYGSPTVFIPQLRKEANSTDAVSVEMASKLSSTFSYSAIVGGIILSGLAKVIGRKLSFLIMCITALIANIFFYFSTTVTQILIGEIIHGPLIATPITLCVMIFTEYTSPQYRGVFLSLKSATFLWGIWVANTIGTFMHWKNIVILAFFCAVYCLLTTLLWPESPYWLVNKNRLEDCAAAHRWLKGYNRESEEELETLIQSRKIIESTPGKSLNSFQKFFKMFTSKLFYKPVILSMLVVSLYHFSGKLACGMYAIDIIKRITGTESTAYTGMLILDGITIVGMYIGCGLSKVLKRRTLILVFSAVGTMFLFCISCYLYLIHHELITENTIVSMLLLTCYSLSISVGPMIMSNTILSELVPVKYRISTILLLGGFVNFLMGSVVKVSPFIMKYFGVRGLFLFFFITESLFTAINYKFLPETKDKTILEIQEGLLAKKPNNIIIRQIDQDNIIC